MNCPCGQNLIFSSCCKPIHQDLKLADTAEKLMRARYSAFVVQNIDFLYNTFHESTRRFQNIKEIEQWAKENKWTGLEIVNSTSSKVEFKAHFLDTDLNPQIHHEKSNFKQQQGLWYYLDGKLIQ